MDPQEAYEKVKDYIHRWREDEKVFQMDPEQVRQLQADPAKARQRVRDVRAANEKRTIYWNSPRQWPQVAREALARLAGSDESAAYRCTAISLIGHCHMREFADLLIRILQDVHDRDGRPVAATALGKLGVKDTLPFLYYTAIDSLAKGDKHDEWLGRFCVKGIYSMLFQFWPSTKEYGTQGSLDRAYMAWWEQNQPSEELLFAWARGEQLPEDDGHGNPRRDDIKYAHLYDLEHQLKEMRDAWAEEDARDKDDPDAGRN